MKNQFKNKHNKSELDKLPEYEIKIDKHQIPSLISFLIYLAILIIIYIGNKYYSEKAMIEESKLKKELKDLRAESLTSMSELMKKTKQTEVARMVREMGLQPPANPPLKIVVNE